MEENTFTNHPQKHRLIVLMLCMMCAISSWAQKLTVESFGMIQGDLSARTYERVDANKMPCGLVKVQLAAPGATFDETGFVIGTVERRGSEYWVYMNQGSYLLQVDCPGFLPLNINLRDYGLSDGIQGKVTYKLVLVMPTVGVQTDNGMRYLTLKVTPKNSKVAVDGKLCNIDEDGIVSELLNKGIHSYQVEAPGYATRTGQITLVDKSVVEEITLESVLASLSVSCPTNGAQIYVNNIQKGSAPWNGTLAAGNYEVEARLNNYRSQKQSITLSEKENRRMELPSLQPITGSLDISYKPIQSEVWLDGKQLGTTPDIFRGIIIGTHDVEIRKGGYETKKERVTVSEGQTASLTGTLAAASSLNTASSNASGGAVSSSNVIETFTVNGVTFNMVRVDGGTFQMGSNDSDAYKDEKPVHQVTLSTYSIGETEVTQALWEAVMGSNPSNWKGSNLPVEQVSWEDCQEFITRLNKITGRSFRLPTEAEWEFAARGGNKSKGYQYSGSNSIGEVAWYHGNSGSETHTVKTKQPNELGIYDMSGNVWEWCQDRYGKYSRKSQTNPTGSSSGSARVDRGGGWYDYARDCRSSLRGIVTPAGRYNNLGLRLGL